MARSISIAGKVFVWHGSSAWYFLPTTKVQGEELRTMQKGKPRAGFGAVRVRVSIGTTVFETSLFPTKDGPYLLPIKASVRKKEGLRDKSPVTARCEFL